MPELPEVETIKRGINQAISGAKILSVDILVPRVLKAPAEEFARRVSGASITGADRRAKILIIHLSSGEAMLFHLMITGSLLYVAKDAPGREKAQVIFNLENGYELRYRDPRLFGYIKLLGEGDVFESPELSHLGPEPLSDDFTFDVLKNLLKKRPRTKVKALLLDQSFIAGIGNIYADETLFYARVHPERPAGSLNDKEIKHLHEGIREVLTKSIEERGSSIATYVDLFGNRGNFANFFKVFGRTGEPCPNGCPGVVEKIKVAGRGTHYCPGCQK